MKRALLTLAVFLVMVCFVVPAYAADTTKTLTFEWSMEDTTNLKEWKLLWSDTSGPPYTELKVIPYPIDGGPVYSSPATIPVTGEQGTHVIKYFVLIACGDVPQEGGGLEYLCSVDSNEVSYDFWIPAGQFSVPVQFNIVEVPYEGGE